MAFGQTNTLLKMGGSSPISTGFNANFSTGAVMATPGTNTTLPKVDTYNARYPGFNKEDYDKLIRLASQSGLTGQKLQDLTDDLYQYYAPQVTNSHKLNDRQVELNRMTYENDGKEPGNTSLKLTGISQKAKQKYGISASVNDDELLGDIVKGTPNGEKLLEDYINNGNPEFLYAAGLEDRPQNLGGVKSLVNPTDKNIVAEKSEWINPVGATAETLDNAAGQFADKWLDWGNMLNEKATDNLKNKLDNMSEKEVEKYRKQYEKLLKNKDWKVGQVEGDTIVEQLWNAVRGNVSYDYDDENFMKWLITQKTNYFEDIAGADEALKGESNPNVVQFFGNIPASAVKTFTATVRGMTNPVDTIKGLYKLAATEEGHQAILNRYGSWDAFAKAMNEDPVGVADDILAVAELGSNIVSGGLKATGKVTGNSSLVNAGNKVSGLNIGSANDALANKAIGSVYGGLDKLADIADNKLVQGAVRYAEDTSSLQKLGENAKADYTALKDSAVGQAIKNYVNEGIDKLVGVSEEDRDFIRNNKKLVNDYIDGKKNVETVFDDVKNKISSKRTTNSEMGREYEVIRANGDTTSTKGLIDELKESLAKEKITVDKKGNLKFDKLSKYNAKQQRAIMDAWEVIQDAQKAKNIDAGTILDLRQKMDDKLVWDGKPADLKDISAVDKSTEKIIKQMRGAIDNRAKTDIAGLKELDEKYAPALQEMDTIKKDWLNSDGTFKDNARSKLRNLTKAGNEERLARLEKVVPGITQDLKALDVGLTVERATKQGVGQYSKNIGLAGTIGFAASGNIPAALISAGVGILATPKNFVRIIEAYPEIASKLQAGQDLLPADINRLQSLAARIADTVE